MKKRAKVANTDKQSRHVFFRTLLRVNNELKFVYSYDGNVQYSSSTVNGKIIKLEQIFIPPKIIAK